MVVSSTTGPVVHHHHCYYRAVSHHCPSASFVPFSPKPKPNTNTKFPPSLPLTYDPAPPPTNRRFLTMGKMTTMESWLGRVGLIRPRNDAAAAATTAHPRIGVLSFEVASLMSKVVRLWQSLSDDHIARLRNETLVQEGVRKLVSGDDVFLLGLALAELLDSLCFLARSTARLGRRCSDPVLRRFDGALADLVATGEDPHGMGYAGRRKMEGKVRKMERFISASVSLYQEMEVLAELELGLKRMAGSEQGGNLLGYRQKVVWQRQEVRCLRDASLWNRSYDYTVRLLARSLFTIVGRIGQVFELNLVGGGGGGGGIGMDVDNARGLRRFHRSVSGPINSAVHPSASGPLRMPNSKAGDAWVSKSGPIPRMNAASSGGGGGSRQCRPQGWTPLRAARSSVSSKPKWPVPAGPFKGCIAVGDGSQVLQSCVPSDGHFRRSSCVAKSEVLNGDGNNAVADNAQFAGSILSKDLSLSLFEPQQKLLVAPPSTLGAAALALHYANVIVVIEKLAASPHLIGPDARDELYNMLPTSIRSELRAKLKAYAKNLSASVYDPVLASEWSDALARILEWLAPLAHNMIRWQSERTYEQQHLFSKTNVLLLQTLYFANQAKTEAAITELLVGLNYLWRFGRELHAKAMLEGMSGESFDDHLDPKG